MKRLIQAPPMYSSTMSETRETVIMDITMLTRFAAAQRFKDLNNSAFSRSRVDGTIDAFKRLRHPAMPALSRGFFDSNVDTKTSKGSQRSEKILDAFATIFAGSGGCVVVGVIRDWEMKVVHTHDYWGEWCNIRGTTTANTQLLHGVKRDCRCIRVNNRPSVPSKE